MTVACDMWPNVPFGTKQSLRLTFVGDSSGVLNLGCCIY